jgi:predicted nucleic acid-binding protein
MVLVDTSIWINHLRDGDKLLEELLINGEVVCHSFIIGELACGNLKNRKEIISLLQSLPMAFSIEPEEFLYFIEQHRLNGKGLGFVDIHLIASAKLDQIKFWTDDKRLRKVAVELGLNYEKG